MANQLSTYTHKQFFNAPTIQKAFDDVWKGAGTQFAVSILSVLQGSQSLKSASNESIYAAAMKAAVLNLPIEPSLGRAYLVPYKGQAQFQLGYKGLIELAQRSGQYKNINAGIVYKSQLISYNPLFEELILDFSKPQDEIVELLHSSLPMLTHNFRASVDFKKVKNMEQIKITGTGTALILDRVNRIFAISGSLTMQWDFISGFKKIDDEPSLDEDGELFETAYDLILAAKPKTKINLTSSYFAKEHKKDIDEIIKVFSFIEDNKRNIFETLGIRGVLE